MNGTDLSGYVPTMVGWQGNQPFVRWHSIGELDWQAPIVAETLAEAERRGCLGGPVETPLEALLEEARTAPGLSPKGLIFHTSRAGAREITRALGRPASTLVLGEPTAVADLFLYMDAFPREDFLLTLRALVSVLGRPRRPGQRHYLVTCWSALAGFLQVFRAAFPEARWLMAYREPAQVLAAILEGPSGIALLQRTPEVPAQWLGLKPERIARLTPLEFTARFLREICLAAAGVGAQLPTGSFLAVDYRRLPDAIVESIVPHFGLELTDDEVRAMRQGYGADRADTDALSPPAASVDGAAIAEIAARLLDPVVRRLAALPQA